VTHPCGDFDEVDLEDISPNTSLKTDLRNAKILSRSDAIVGAVDPNSLMLMQRARLPRRTNDCPEAHGSTRDCGHTKACKYLTNDYIRKRHEWICKNFLKVLDCEMGFMYRCGVEC